MKIRCALLLGLATAVAAQEDVVNLESTIIGNQEQPRVLHLLPWKDADEPDALPLEFDAEMDELLQPLDRDDFVRELEYREQFRNP